MAKKLIDIDLDVLARAMEVSGASTYKEVVNAGLREIIAAPAPPPGARPPADRAFPGPGTSGHRRPGDHRLGMAAVARYLLDTSAWSRRNDPVVARRVTPLMGAGLIATCSVLDAEALYSTRSPGEYAGIWADRFEAFEFLTADQEVWDRVLEVQRQLALRSMTRAVGYR